MANKQMNIGNDTIKVDLNVNGSLSQGNQTVAAGEYSTALGNGSSATGIASYAEGSSCFAYGSNSHAHGAGTITYTPAGTVIGKFNEVDENQEYVEVVGNGESGNRSNARTLDWDGNAWFAGDVKATDGNKTISMKTLNGNHKYIFIGDSYGIGENASGQTVPWINKVVNNLGLTSDDYYSMAVGGYGFAADAGTFLSLLQSINIPDNKKKDITRIVICGGFNDRTHYQDVENAIIEIKQYIDTNFNNAQLYVGFISWELCMSVSDQWLSLNTTFNTYKKSTESVGGIFMNGLQYIMHNYSFFNDSDLVHPNQDGQNALGLGISTWLKTGKYENIEMMKPISTTPVTSTTTVFKTGSVYESIQNESVNLLYTGNGIFYTTSIIPKGNNPSEWMDLCVIREGFIRGNKHTVTITKIPIRLNNQSYEADLRFYYGTLQIRIYNTTSTDIAIGAIGKIFEFSANYPTMMC